MGAGLSVEGGGNPRMQDFDLRYCQLPWRLRQYAQVQGIYWLELVGTLPGARFAKHFPD